MDETRADEDTKDDVDILILDYVLCMTIHIAIKMIKSNPGDQDTAWLEDPMQMLRAMLLPTQDLPMDIQIKAQVLEIIKIFNTAVRARPIMLANMAHSFVSACESANKDVLQPYATEVATHLCIHAAFRMYRDSNNGSSKGFDKYLARLPEGEGKAPEYITQTLPSIGISEKACLETIRQTVRVNESGPTIPLDTLVNIMQLLEPPVLLQLERGKLKGLSRAKTQQLKQRVGMD
ncbi:hypothetical protein BDW62DRAFT_42085 [Aspergillus aurantiobrunneus]